MPILDVEFSRLPLPYWLCAALIIVALVFAVRQRHLLWVPAFVGVLGTVAAWYMVEPLYFEDFLFNFSSDAVDTAYTCLLVFLVTFLVTTPLAVGMLQPGPERESHGQFSITPEQIAPRVVLLWLALLAIGVFRMNGDVLGALFPIGGRVGASMWSRDAAEGAGASGFLVSAGAYLYILALGFLGLLIPIVRKPSVRWLLVACIVISWPYAILQGSRHVTLAVIMPMVIAFLLLGFRSPLARIVVAVLSFMALDFLMRAVIDLRDVGFDAGNFKDIEEAKHLGLNMASELVYVAGFVQARVIEISYGGGYLAELLNVVPRAIWENKPLIGIDYAIARGFGGGDSDIGVVATISTGMVGQGVANFGLWFGPAFAAILMSIWVGFLARLRYQGGAARTGLFLVGLGLTFNLGRDITLLVLFPFFFGYAAVLLLEARDRRKRAQRALAEKLLWAGPSQTLLRNALDSGRAAKVS
jgi:hypothetical protein